MNLLKKHLMASDEVFVSGMRQQDQTLMKRLYKMYYPMVLFMVTSNSGSEAEAKDIYQEAFIVLYERLSKPNFTLSCSIKTYLYSVSRRLWLKQLNRQGRKLEGPLQDVEEFLPLIEADGSIEEKELQLQQIETALKELGEPCATIITDYYINEMSMVQIAEKMGYTNADNAKTQKYKCFTRLKKIMSRLTQSDT
jgi:RNA polymerase sigma factor (sigma-70 family)